MRTPKDRTRQAISFEVIGLMLAIPLGAFVFGFRLQEFGVLGLIGASIATVWNYLYNLLFDHALKRWTGSTKKRLRMRVVHAVGFELGLMLVFLPIVAWWLDIGLIEALVIDLAFVVFYLAYAFVFTWCYDTVFPDPDSDPDPMKPSLDTYTAGGRPAVASSRPGDPVRDASL
jgi:uncharacterized membrane protein